MFSTGAPTAEDSRFPLLRRFWKNIPEYGNISVFDRSWYRDISIAAVEDNIGKKELRARTAEILGFEEQLCDDGYLLLKFFLHISKAEQKKRFAKLESSRATSWRVTDADWSRNKRYSEYRDAFKAMLEATDTDIAAVVPLSTAADKDAAALEVCSTE